MGKVFKNGHSLAVTIPKIYAHQLNIKHGSQLEWQKTDTGLMATLTQPKKKADQVDPQVVKLIDKLSVKYSQVWEDLSKL